MQTTFWETVLSSHRFAMQIAVMMSNPEQSKHLKIVRTVIVGV